MRFAECYCEECGCDFKVIIDSDFPYKNIHCIACGYRKTKLVKPDHNGDQMSEKGKEKEVFSTEYIDKKLPTIYYHRHDIKSFTEGTEVTIEISDKTSKIALDTFKKLKEMVDEDV